jgi:pimeloyl-ACP methyl ester carboxylesterase
MDKHPNQSFLMINGARLALYAWPGAGTPILFAHATGFHARCWDQVIARLAGRQCYAVDLRGHGRSDKPEPPYNWRTYGEDVAALADALGLRGALAVGHSMGGHAITLAAAHNPPAFAALLLLDPVILPRAFYDAPPLNEHFAARRRNRWASADEMFERFRDRLPFSRWDQAVLRDYCTHGLLRSPDNNSFVLACPPEVEAGLYLASSNANIYGELAKIEAPVRVVRAETPARDVTEMSASPTAPDLAAHFRRGEDMHLPEHSHFIPMESPALVAHYIQDMQQMAAPR